MNIIEVAEFSLLREYLKTLTCIKDSNIVCIIFFSTIYNNVDCIGKK